MGNALPAQRRNDEARKRARCGHDDAEAGAIFVREKLMRGGGDRLCLFPRVQAGEEDGFALFRSGFFRGFDRFRFAEILFPCADPGGVEIFRGLAGILKNDGGVFRRLHGRAQEMPVRPMRAVKSGDEKIAEGRCRLGDAGEHLAIGRRAESELGRIEVRVESPHDRTKSGEIDLAKIRPGGCELLEQTQEMIRRAANGNRGETFGLRKGGVG